MQQKRNTKLLLSILAALGWFALAGQFYLILQNRVTSVAETIIRYFSFFTILKSYSSGLLHNTFEKIQFKIGRLFPTKTITAIAGYITIVSLVYNMILHFLWKPEGLQWIVDELLHTIIPILFIVLWLFFIPKANIKWSSVLSWPLYPLIYLMIILLRGNYSSFYPYPFIDVTKIGYKKVLINSTGMLLAFLSVSILFVIINRFKKN